MPVQAKDVSLRHEVKSGQMVGCSPGGSTDGCRDAGFEADCVMMELEHEVFKRFFPQASIYNII